MVTNDLPQDSTSLASVPHTATIAHPEKQTETMAPARFVLREWLFHSTETMSRGCTGGGYSNQNLAMELKNMILPVCIHYMWS